MKRFIVIGLGLMMAAFTGCETTSVAPIAPGAAPLDQTSDEAGLWLQVDKMEARLKTAASVVRDPALNAYVREVTCKVTGPDYCKDLRIYIVDAPHFNASMAPNGMMQVGMDRPVAAGGK